ncbi:MAG TPA: threonine synthase [Anaerolineales bacterium]|nr:threonine synthase [Anaerolineales bacterium]
MPAPSHLQCSICGTHYHPAEVMYTCPLDGGNLTVCLDVEAVQAVASPHSISAQPDRSVWRYLPLLPVKSVPSQPGPLRSLGNTPFFHATRLGEALGLSQLWLKDDGQLPTGSFKDRASSLIVQRAIEQGIDRIVTASTGNAGVALAGMAAAASGVRAVIYLPKSAPQAKIAQLMVYGAEIHLVDGNYDAAFELSLKVCAENGWYCRNTGYNPYTTEGKKTTSFEICEQFTLQATGQSLVDGRWLAPDRVFVSVGDGNIISGVQKGFRDLYDLGWISHIPKLMGIQAEGSAAIANAFFAGNENIQPVNAQTLADSISADLPRDGLRALRAVTHTHGAYLTVSDDEILQAQVRLARQSGVYAEPAASTAFAGLLKAQQTGQIGKDEHIVVLLTGNGLKDVRATLQAVEKFGR